MSTKIFISSTCHDLIDIRAELEKELLDLNLVPILSDRPSSEFETFPDKNSIETCLINVIKCDAVVVILSQRYGPSLKSSGFDDISATHLEYHEAKRSNKPIFFYVRDRLEAEHNLYEKSREIKDLKWIKKTDLKLFDFFEEHKKLSNTNNNNWYYSFKDSTDLKERIRIDLKSFSKAAILNKIIKEGNAPFLISHIGVTYVPNTPHELYTAFEIKNIGKTAAIDPVISMYTVKNLQDLLDQNSKYYELNPGEAVFNYKIPTLLPGEHYTVKHTIKHDIYGNLNKEFDLILEAGYGTIAGERLSDISVANIHYNNADKAFNCFAYYKMKKYFHNNAFDYKSDSRVKK